MFISRPFVNILKYIILMSVFINLGSTTGILQSIISPIVSVFERLNEGTFIFCCKCHHVDNLKEELPSLLVEGNNVWPKGEPICEICRVKYDCSVLGHCNCITVKELSSKYLLIPKIYPFTDLHNQLKGLYGQHIAEKEILKSVSLYFEQPNPTHYSLFGEKSGMDPSDYDSKRVKPLGIVMYGLSGTGKSFACKLIAESIYKLGFMSPLVHIFRAPLDIDSDNYKMNLMKWIKGNLTLCENSMFIFDECEKWPHDVIIEIKSLLQPCYLNDPFTCATSKGIFLFLTHTGGAEIVKFILKKYEEGIDREDIDAEDFKNAVDVNIFTDTDQMWSMKTIIEFLWPVNKILDGVWFSSSKEVTNKIDELQDDFIDVYIPFLPLEKKHVRRCIVDYLIDKEERYPSDSMVNEVLKHLEYRPEGNKIFTSTGCKRVHSLFINALAETHKTRKHDEL